MLKTKKQRERFAMMLFIGAIGVSVCGMIFFFGGWQAIAMFAVLGCLMAIALLGVKLTLAWIGRGADKADPT